METVINGKKVVFRDKFPARFGWGLLGAAVRLNDKRREYVMLDSKGNPVLDKDGNERLSPDMPSYVTIISDVFTFDEITRFVRGAVESWEFDGDLSTDEACDNLSPVSELMNIAIEAISLFNKSDTSGEAVGSPISE